MSGDKASVQLQRAPPPPEEATRRLLQEGAVPLPTPSYSFLGPPEFITHGGQKEIYMGQPIELTTLVFLLDFANCSTATGWRYMSFKAVREALFANSSLPNNLQNYYRTCLYDKARLATENVLIVRRPINITCAGVLKREGLPDAPYNSSVACGAAEQQAWEREAAEQAKLIAEQDIAKLNDTRLDDVLRRQPRRRHIYILPPKVPCGWAGYGDVTCTTYICCSFVRASSYNTLNVTDLHVIMHEAMHNFGLEHAQTEDDPYGDPTDVMGNFANRAGLICPSAPQMYRIGVATPLKGWEGDKRGTLGNLTASNFTDTGQTTLTIPAAAERDDNMVVVTLGRKDGADRYAPANESRIYFLSYRVGSPNPFGYDSGLTAVQNGTVLVHQYDGIQDEILSIGKRPTFLANVSRGGVWRSPFVEFRDDLGGQLVVTVRSANATHATVTICRARATVEIDCSDGHDDDCDGQRDRCDTDCVDRRNRPRICPKLNS